MNRIRVLHILPSLKAGGAERQILTLLPLLPNSEIDVGVLAVYASRLADAERTQLGCPVIEVGRRRRSDYSFPFRLIRQIKGFAPQIVHTHTHVGKYWGRMAARAAGVPIILHTAHNPCDPRRNPLERLLDPLLYASTSRVITFLEDQRATLARLDGFPPEKIAIIPNGILPRKAPAREERLSARRSLGVSDDAFVILVVGRLEQVKNQRLALDALAALPEQARVRIRLFVLGSGSQETALRDLAHERALREHVAFLGHRTDVADLLPGGDLMLMTSLYEGMPLVLIEAMFAGVPILTTPWTGARSMLVAGSCGYLAEGWNPQQLAAALERALRDPRERLAVAERARLHAADQYDIQKMAEAHRTLYLELAGARSLPSMAAAS
ncbi:MAG: glycosyltransferase [bacterium]|nr:glycosyltransferase [bacterium]